MLTYACGMTKREIITAIRTNIHPYQGMGEEQPDIKSEETSFRLEEEIEFLAPPSNLLTLRGESWWMEENAHKKATNMAVIKCHRF